MEKNDENQSVTHVPSGFCAMTVSIFEQHDYKLHCYLGENVMDEFYNYMNKEELQNNAMIELTAEQQNRVCDTCT